MDNDYSSSEYDLSLDIDIPLGYISLIETAFNGAHVMSMQDRRIAMIPQKLRDIGAECGYILDYKSRTKKVRGWTSKSKKPWHILYGDGTLVCSFETLDKLETNLRGRCGC